MAQQKTELGNGWSKSTLCGVARLLSRDYSARMRIAIASDHAATDLKADLAEWLKGQVPLGRYGKPEEVAALVSFLVGPEASYITGTRMIVDGGLTA